MYKTFIHISNTISSIYKIKTAPPITHSTVPNHSYGHTDSVDLFIQLKGHEAKFTVLLNTRPQSWVLEVFV